MITAYWAGTAGDFKKLSFTDWLIESCANVAILNVDSPMVEKDFQSAFTRFMRDNPPTLSAVFELKLEKGTSLAFNKLAPHQLEALRDASNGRGLYYRIMDQPWMPDRKYSFSKPKPFDCFFVQGVKAYVVVLFYKPRKPKEAIFIEAQQWIDEVGSSKRKSLTEIRAREISSKILVI